MTPQPPAYAARLESWQKPDVEFHTFGEHEKITVGGREVPYLTAWHRDAEVTFCVGASGITCDLFDAEQVARIIASALAVGAGYVGWPEPDGDFVVRPFAPIVHLIGEVQTDD